MTKITVYKVVHRRIGALCSFWAAGRSRVRYRPGEWAQAPTWLVDEGYYLLAFKSLDMARKLHGYMDREYEIWEAVGESEITPLPPVLDLANLSCGLIWSRDDIRDIPPWPEGTCMFRRIKLVRKIHEEGPNVQAP